MNAAPLEHFERHACGDWAGQPREVPSSAQLSSRITAQEQFKSAQRLLMRQERLFRSVLEAAKIGPRKGDFLFVAHPDSLALPGQRQ